MTSVIIYGTDEHAQKIFRVLNDISFQDVDRISLVQTSKWSAQSIQETRRKIVDMFEMLTDEKSIKNGLELTGVDIDKRIINGNDLMTLLVQNIRLWSKYEDDKILIIFDVDPAKIIPLSWASLTNRIRFKKIWFYSDEDDELVTRDWPSIPFRTYFKDKNERDMLELIVKEKSIDMGTLANKTNLSNSTISRRTQRFEKHELVKRERSGRKFKLVPTPTAEFVLAFTDPNIFNNISS